MSIEFDCPSCGKHFSVSDGLAGKRAKCRWCQGPIAVPHPAAPEPVPADDYNDLSALESAVSATSGGAYSNPAHAAGGYDADDYTYGQPVAPVAMAHDAGPALPPAPPPFRGRAGIRAVKGPAGGLPPWAAPLFATLGRSRGLPWWAWAGIVVAAIFLLGLVSDLVATAAAFLLGGAGLLLLAVAAVWAVVVGVALGSRAMVGIILASPVIALIVLVRFTFRQANGGYEKWSALSSRDAGFIVGVLVGAVGIVAVIVGMLSNPRAFKWPALMGLAGVLFLTVCWMPLSYRGSSRSSAGYATRSSGRQVTGPPPDWNPRQIVATPARKTARPPVFETPAADEPATEPPTTPPDLGKSPPAKPTPSPVMPTPIPVDRVKAAEPAPQPPTTPAAVAPAVPAPPAIRAAPAVVVPLPAWVVVNAKIQAKWGATWYDARVVRVERGWAQVEYQSDRTREWVEPWRTRAAGSKADDVPPTSPNATWNKPDAPAPDGVPAAKPAR